MNENFQFGVKLLLNDTYMDSLIKGIILVIQLGISTYKEESIYKLIKK